MRWLVCHGIDEYSSVFREDADIEKIFENELYDPEYSGEKSNVYVYVEQSLVIVEAPEEIVIGQQDGDQRHILFPEWSKRQVQAELRDHTRYQYRKQYQHQGIADIEFVDIPDEVEYAEGITDHIEVDTEQLDMPDLLGKHREYEQIHQPIGKSGASSEGS
jgi:hypothetical protein